MAYAHTWSEIVGETDMKHDMRSLFDIAEIEIIYRHKQRREDRPVLNSSKRAYDILRSAWDENKLELQEQFKVLLLDTGCRALGIYDVGMGGIDYTPVDIRLILATALKARATKLVLSHNHPSGTLSPSQADRNLTNKICHAASLMDIQVADHVIVTRDGYYSFADEGILPTVSTAPDFTPL
ncbi:JAB domain-containing protein [Sphingobacterium siyangense]|uniref:JAB domain-containing protein n=1 Tax=Sphingobacterium siyangense TaxID=459529 RepID=UPI003DA4B24D